MTASPIISDDNGEIKLMRIVEVTLTFKKVFKTIVHVNNIFKFLKNIEIIAHNNTKVTLMSDAKVL